MGFEEPYWVDSARILARLFEHMPDVNPSDLGDNFQEFLKSYVPPAGSWDERMEAFRSVFVQMGDKQFRGVYETYLEERDKPGFKNWEESS
jgi:hypothetical protein